ncbi:TrmH family tRNA, rRNA methyltransferase YacO [Fructilactobacillus florum 8D]|uniref:TrmH family tRNA, rRNA methyltransferase YacO n=1 Tax=Fructilactobacillus florum 8D TaxID=1221538 RepID=W9EDU7_9LACO|nr:23S rRNA (guanosine(2251)-2'-O)-methyltransferase RlmB [Fructilactobacillus florum]ETO40267.1 TrmH family tRNA, rRNA methyltransferase YacO [Fructilactobacillus florum 8D]
MENKHDFIMGRHPVVAALQNQEQSINKLFLQSGLHQQDATLRQIVQLAKKRQLVVSMVPKSKLDQLTNHQNHQGVVLAVAAFRYATLDDLFARAAALHEPPLFLLLDSIDDPHNLGSMLRTADAAGFHGIIIPKHRAVGLTATVAKTAAGAIERVPVARVTNLVQTVKELKERGVWVFGTDLSGTDYRHWDAKGASALIIGSEGSGMAPLLKKQVDEMLTIPMIGKIQSLNASVAAGLVMYRGYDCRHPLAGEM